MFMKLNCVPDHRIIVQHVYGGMVVERKRLVAQLNLIVWVGARAKKIWRLFLLAAVISRHAAI